MIKLERHVLSKDEFVEYFWVINRRAAIREFKPLKRFWILSVVLGSCIGASLLCSLTNRPEAQLAPLAIGSVGFVLGVIVLVYALLLALKRFRLGRRYNKDPHMTAEVTIEIEDAFFRNKTGPIEVKVDWGEFKEVVETPKLYLLVLNSNPNLALLVPRRAFASPQSEKEFRDLMSKKNLLRD